MSDEHADGEEYLAEDEAEIVLAYWDCTSCDTKKIRGDVYECENCGSDRPEDVKFYLPDPENAEVISDQAGVAAAEAGADWRCEYCDSWMAASVETCTNCGGGEEGESPKQSTETYNSLDEIPQNTEEARHGKAKKVNDEDGDDGQAEAKSGGGCIKSIMTLMVLGVMGIFLMCCVMTVFLPGETRKEVTVVEHTWSLKTELEEFRTVSEGGWSKPSGAFEVSSERKLHHNDQVIDHYDTRYRQESYQVRQGSTTESYTEKVRSGTKRVRSGTTTKNLGNGRFKKIPRYKNVPVYKTVRKTRQVPRYVTKYRRVAERHPVYRNVPIYKTYYKYKVNRWFPFKTLKNAGSGKSPKWPDLSPYKIRSGKALEVELGQKRVKSKNGVFSIKVRNKEGREYVKQLGESRWGTFDKGQKVVVLIESGHVKSVIPMTEDQAQKGK
ncbi:MAG: hypothetical protein P1V97_11795 [Planctomycetota bacterium]|nr:hypothetical protein [Planctomycetota bacterium]